MTFKQKYTDKMILDIIDELEVVSTRQVKDRLGCSFMTADSRLKNLVAAGKVKRINVGTAGKPTWIYSRR